MTGRPSILVTIVIPYYRGIKHLKMAIESVLCQSTTNWRLIVVDDLGGEDAELVTNEYQDHRITYRRNEENIGIAANWNRAVSLSNSQYTVILHADDILEPTYIEEMVKFLEKNPQSIAAHCRATIIGEDGNKIHSLVNTVKILIRPLRLEGHTISGDGGLARLMIGDWIICPTLCYRTTYLRNHPFDENLKFVVDLEWIAAALLDGQKIATTRKSLYRYRVHPGTQTSILTASSHRFLEEINLMSKIFEKAKDKRWKKTRLLSFVMLSIRLHLVIESTKSVFSRDFKRSRELLHLSTTTFCCRKRTKSNFNL